MDTNTNMSKDIKALAVVIVVLALVCIVGFYLSQINQSDVNGDVSDQSYANEDLISFAGEVTLVDNGHISVLISNSLDQSQVDEEATFTLYEGSQIFSVLQDGSYTDALESDIKVGEFIVVSYYPTEKIIIPAGRVEIYNEDVGAEIEE
jgi:hypothetical protein|tara:strand:- start:311 stop:757 length:447 start_codon:yes stop_codon:yes gene_type:complete